MHRNPPTYSHAAQSSTSSSLHNAALIEWYEAPTEQLHYSSAQPPSNRISATVSPDILSNLITSLAAISNSSSQHFEPRTNAYVSKHSAAAMSGEYGLAVSSQTEPSLRTESGHGSHEAGGMGRGYTKQGTSETSPAGYTNTFGSQQGPPGSKQLRSTQSGDNDSVSIVAAKQPSSTLRSNLAPASKDNRNAIATTSKAEETEQKTPAQLLSLALERDEIALGQDRDQTTEGKDHTRQGSGIRPFSLLQLKTQTSPGLNGAGSDSPATSSPGLENHLIPSRRSSIRRSVVDPARDRDSKRMSVSSQDLRDLQIDEGLIAEDHSTVRRIKELQDAKEKRQSEWRRDGRKPDRPKRNSMPSPTSVHKHVSRHSTQSVVGIVMEVPEKERKVAGDAAVSNNDSGALKLSPAESTLPSRTPSILSTKSASVTAPRERRQATTLPQHRRGLSTTLRRSITTNAFPSDVVDLTQSAVEDEVETFLKSPTLTQRIKHPRTSRVIAFSEVGDPKGFPVICCVGMGLTRYVMAFYDELARSLKLRLITPDRPGVGESGPCHDGKSAPLNWADDIYVLCSSLGIEAFSLLAHSAGAIYALAVALRLPNHVRGRLHLLAPWIPPSQMTTMSNPWGSSTPAVEMPLGQKLLSVLPTSFLKIANASFMSATSASISPRARSKRKIVYKSKENLLETHDENVPSNKEDIGSILSKPPVVSCYQATTASLIQSGVISTAPTSPPSTAQSTPTVHVNNRQTKTTPEAAPVSTEKRLAMYNEVLTHRIWELATTNANPAADLVVCLERRGPIGFKYTDVNRPVVVYHGAKDTRVPIENIRLLEKAMPRCELKVLPEDGHGLMASATVMATVLTDMEKEWSDYERVVRRGQRMKSRGQHQGDTRPTKPQEAV